ncbi:MAG: hypothetical protein L0271_11835 [Gemmatimonadetes bacterium]|nr:hypothetical protein [Gemmatimonadota bacterium]
MRSAARDGARVIRLATALVVIAASTAATRAVQQTPSLRRGAIELHFDPEQAALARSLVPLLEQPLPLLPGDALEGPPGITIHLAPDEERFSALTGGRAPSWGAGVAFPDAGVIVLPSYGGERGPAHELPRVLRHELAHVALQRFLGPARIPRWFSEGYATWSAGQLDEDAAWILRLAFLTGRAPPLDSIVLDWPAATLDARVAYLLSASAVAWLLENGGERAFTLFLSRWKQTSDFERALYDTWGLTPATLERDWSAAVRRRYGWLLFLAQSVVIWTLTGLIALVLVFIRRRRDRRRLARLRANEIPDDPAYWMFPDAEGPAVDASPAHEPGGGIPETGEDAGGPERRPGSTRPANGSAPD